MLLNCESLETSRRRYR